MHLEVGEVAPSFTLFDTDRKLRSLAEFRGKKLVLAFFPGAFTSVCTKEMCSFRDSLSKFNQLGSQVLGVSVDSPFANKGFSEKNGLNFPILSDYGREVISKYGIVLNNFAGLQGYDAAKRSVFVLDAEGRVQYRWVSDDPGKEPLYGEVERAIGAIV